jgi:hypothetical protein
MGVPIDVTLIADPIVRKGLQNGTLKLFGSVVRRADSGRIFRHLPEMGKRSGSSTPLVMLAVVGVALVAGVAAYVWSRNKSQTSHPLSLVLGELESDLQHGMLDLKTAKNIHEQLGTFLGAWQDRAADQRAKMPQAEIDALQKLLSLLREINKQVSPTALEAGEVQGSIRLLERTLIPMPPAWN